MHVLFCDSDNFFRSKFILPKEGKEWVMTGVQEAWKGYKTRIKGKHFEIYNNIEVILKNRPLDIPEVQFRKLITYWSIPSVKALSRLNSENRKKQQHQHRMGPKSFARTRNEMIIILIFISFFLLYNDHLKTR
nr:uncharacterized protein LOC112746897 isoform X2 [Arachis hypogaea]